MLRFIKLLLLGSVMIALVACQSDQVYVKGKNITVAFNNQMHSRIIATVDGRNIPLGEFQPGEYITIDGKTVTDFRLLKKVENPIQDQAELGKGTEYILSGEIAGLSKEIRVRVYEDFPGVAVFMVKYTNNGNKDLEIESWTNNHYQIQVQPGSAPEPAFWSFNSGSYEDRADWILPLKEGFKKENYMGMNASDYGGGTPVVDVWRRDVGIGVGHLELVPKLVSLPVNMPSSGYADLEVTCNEKQVLKPGENMTTLLTFTKVHTGDYYQTLITYRDMMIKRGIHFDPVPATSYEPIWCAWGYRRNFTMPQIYGTLPMVKELGYKWAVLDDGWQTSEGDWYLLKDKFPKGDADMKKLVDKIHAEGIKAGLWWAPLAADSGTVLLREHPEYLLINKDGKYQDISWWDSYYLCPAYPPVQEYTNKLVEKFIRDWGYDGLKIDGQHLNAAPPCYNPLHKHTRPEEAFEKVPEFFKGIYETARSIKPDVVIEICPCGTAYAFHTMPFMTQSVASDPESSWQIRLKGKTIKALMGRNAAYFGDHIELSDGRDDFASVQGIGAIVGTKFTWPVGAMKKGGVDLTPEREKVWKKWMDIYSEHMLPEAEYQGELYDLGFDRPEAHAIRKGDKMYYAFYADSCNSTIELRGLENRKYKVLDYENQKDFGEVSGPIAKLPVQFKKHLLLMATPE
jgi:alpha-galactosidase